MSSARCYSNFNGNICDLFSRYLCKGINSKYKKTQFVNTSSFVFLLLLIMLALSVPKYQRKHSMFALVLTLVFAGDKSGMKRQFSTFVSYTFDKSICLATVFPPSRTKKQPGRTSLFLKQFRPILTLN